MCSCCGNWTCVLVVRVSGKKEEARTHTHTHTLRLRPFPSRLSVARFNARNLSKMVCERLVGKQNTCIKQKPAANNNSLKDQSNGLICEILINLMFDGPLSRPNGLNAHFLRGAKTSPSSLFTTKTGKKQNTGSPPRRSSQKFKVQKHSK